MAAAPSSGPTTKKSFFKRPTWATNAPLTESRDFFRHSDTVYDSILRDKERRREKHAQKRQAKAGSEAADESRDVKRRRISTDEEAHEDGQSNSEMASSSPRRDTTPTTDTTASRAKSPTTSSSLAPARSTSQPESSLTHTTAVESNTIHLDSDDDTRQTQGVLPEIVPASLPDEEISEEEDEYVLQLKQKAREKPD